MRQRAECGKLAVLAVRRQTNEKGNYELSLSKSGQSATAETVPFLRWRLLAGLLNQRPVLDELI